MSDPTDITAEWRARSPLMTRRGWRLLQRLRQHQHAPRWNFETGDRLEEGDLEVVDEFRKALNARALASAHDAPPQRMLDAIRGLRKRSWFLQDQIPVGYDLDRDWGALATMDRDDLATRLVEVVPFDVSDFDRFLVYDTSGTSGHAVHVPHEPTLLAKSHTFAEFAMRLHGADSTFEPDTVSCLNLCAQASTYVFASVFTVWNESGFVKANLNEDDWAGGRSAARSYLHELDARLVTSDPISLTEGMRWDLELRPEAIISTAVHLQPGVQARLAEYYECPVIDWYSTTETGPIACSAPDGDGLVLLPHDLYIEVVDEQGRPVADGELGEVCVTTLRNPFLPLVRYRTGDFARLERGAEPRLRDLHGRAPVFFRAASGSLVSSVDIGRAMRLVTTFAQHQVVQSSDGACEVRLRPLGNLPVNVAVVRNVIEKLFGEVPLDVVIDEELGAAGKVVPYLSELEL